MPTLSIDGVTKRYGDGFAVSDLSLVAEPGEIVCILGPSGCGKTTLLRLIAGLEAPDSGTISLDGAPLEGVGPQQRGFGLMFQDLALFPHMDVASNVGFGLRMQKRPKAEASERVGELLGLVGLAGFGPRKVHELSGGERQRVALARSLAPEPKLLMLDEPLGSLDRVLRESLVVQIRDILKAVGVTAIYVTHDREEAFAIADRIVVMDQGSIVQVGTPEELFMQPANELVARSMGIRNVLNGRVTGRDVIETEIGSLRAPLAPGFADGSAVLVLVDERRITVGQGWLGGVIESRAFHGGEYELTLRVGEGRLVALVPSTGAGNLGDEVSVEIPPDAIRAVPA